jgi:hypothetical protein
MYENPISDSDVVIRCSNLAEIAETCKALIERAYTHPKEARKCIVTQKMLDVQAKLLRSANTASVRIAKNNLNALQEKCNELIARLEELVAENKALEAKVKKLGG